MEPCLFRHGKKYNFLSFSSGMRLQWSHVFSDMVSLVELEVRPVGGDASMEPCLFRHGKGELSSLTRRSPACFNGAMSFQTW